MDITKNAIWTHDCQGKQDLDFRIIHAFTRYYPDHSAICSMELCPDEAGEGITLCESDIMHGHSEGEIKQMVREWYNANILDAFKKAIEELGIAMEKFYEEYLNGLIAKAKKSWEGVDVDSYMSDLRDDTDKEDAEKEQKALENLKKAIKKAMEE